MCQSTPLSLWDCHSQPSAHQEAIFPLFLRVEMRLDLTGELFMTLLNPDAMLAISSWLSAAWRSGPYGIASCT